MRHIVDMFTPQAFAMAGHFPLRASRSSIGFARILLAIARSMQKQLARLHVVCSNESNAKAIL